MRSLILRSVFILSLAAGTVLAAGDNVSGIWKVSGSVYGNAIEQSCSIRQEEKKLTGTCKADGTPDATISGEVNDKNITWQFNADYNGTQLTLVYSGTLDEDSSKISGKIKVAPFGVEGDFTARKEVKEEGK